MEVNKNHLERVWQTRFPHVVDSLASIGSSEALAAKLRDFESRKSELNGAVCSSRYKPDGVDLHPIVTRVLH